MAVAACIWCLGGVKPIRLTAAPVIVAGVLLTQIVPLPEGLLVRLSPVSAGAWKVATAGLPGALACISVDPAATWTGIRNVLLGAATTVAIIDLGRLQNNRRILLAALALSGTLTLLIGLVAGRLGDNLLMLGFFDLTGPIQPRQSPLILPAQSTGVGIAEWVVVETQRYQFDSGAIGGCVGTFFYGNHFAAAVCLTLPVILAGWLWFTVERLPEWMRWLAVGTASAAGMWAVAWVAGSRAGTGALGLTLATFLSLVAPMPWMRRLAGLFTVIMAVALFLFLVAILLPGDTVLNIVPPDFKKQAAKLLADGRAGPAHVAIRAFLASPILGTGLDSFQYVFPRFYTDRFTLFYAHNEFAQLLAETGMLGLIILGWLTWFLIPKAIRFWREAPGRYRLLNAGPWAALAGITAHSAFDWNLHLPAIALLTVIVVGLAASSVPGRKPSAVSQSWIPESVARWLLVACCVIAVAGLWRDAISETVQFKLRKAIVADRLAEKDHNRPPATEALASAIFAGESLARWDQKDANLLITLGQAELHLARLKPTGEERSRLMGTADRWFQRARLASAMCRGLPEPIANLRAKPKR